MILTKQIKHYFISRGLCLFLTLFVITTPLSACSFGVTECAQQKTEEDYKIQPKDILEIIIDPNYGHPLTIHVNAEGKANFRLIGWVEAKDKTIRKLTEELIVLYSEYLIDPKIEVRLIKKYN